MKWLCNLVLLQVLMVVGAIFVIWQVVVFLRPRPPPCTPAELNAVTAVCKDFSRQLAGKLATPTRVGLAHLFGDSHDAATLALRAAVSRIPGCTLEEKSIIKKFLMDVTKAVSEATSLDEVLTAGRKVELDVVIAGRVVALEALPDGGERAALSLYAYDVRHGGWLVKEVFTTTWQPGVLDHLRATPFWLRLGIFALLVGLLPWLTFFATRWALEKKDNLASVIVVGCYTGADVLLALALDVIQFGQHWFMPALIMLLCAGWNYWACERVAKHDGAQ